MAHLSEAPVAPPDELGEPGPQRPHSPWETLRESRQQWASISREKPDTRLRIHHGHILMGPAAQLAPLRRKPDLPWAVARLSLPGFVNKNGPTTPTPSRPDRQHGSLNLFRKRRKPLGVVVGP